VRAYSYYRSLSGGIPAARFMAFLVSTISPGFLLLLPFPCVRISRECVSCRNATRTQRGRDASRSRLDFRRTKVCGRFFRSADPVVRSPVFFFFFFFLRSLYPCIDNTIRFSVPSLGRCPSRDSRESRSSFSASSKIPADFLFRKVPQSREARSARCEATRVAPAILIPPVGPGRFF